MITIKKILVPTDFSELSKIALPYAVDLARKYGAKIIIFHSFDEDLLTPIVYETGWDAEKYFAKLQTDFDAAVEQFLEGIDIEGIEIESHLVSGKPFVEILKFVKEQGIDLIVMSTHGRSGLTHALLGSVTEKVVRKSPCPVMVVRHPEFEFKMV